MQASHLQGNLRGCGVKGLLFGLLVLAASGAGLYAIGWPG